MGTNAPTVQAALDTDTRALDDWPALARRDGESCKAYAALLDYVRMGPGRSLRKLHAAYCRQVEGEAGAEKPPTKRLATLETWSSVNAWQDRLAAYQHERIARDQAVWEARRRALQEADFVAGEALRELAAQILTQTPQFLKTTRRLVKGGQGQPDREVITVELDGGFLLKTLKLASDLQREASGINVQRHEIIMPPDIVELWSPFVEAVKALGMEPVQVLEAVMAQASAEKAQQDGDDD